jgi:ribonuclease BN (tRNA processing enzyme)
MSNTSLTIIGYWGAYPGPGEATSRYLIRSGDATGLRAFDHEEAPGFAKLGNLNFSLGSACRSESKLGFGPFGADFVRKTNLLICETSLYNENRGKISGHMSAGEAGTLAKEADVGMLVATHLPHYGEQERLKDQALSAFGGHTLLAR